MKRLFPILLVAVLVAAAVFEAGCASNSAGKLQVAGSTSVQPHAEVLARAFQQNNSGTRVYVQGGGSSAGIQAVGEGTAAIGMSSRAVKASEIATYPTLKPVAIAVDGIAMIVNPKNPVNNLTMNQTRDIFTGNITNWNQVGGSDATINVINREQGSGTRDGVQTIVLKGGNFAGGIVLSSTGAIRTAVSQDVNAIGYISSAEVDSSVKAVNIDGAAPTYDNIANRSYKIQRDFFFVTKGDPSGLASQFINFTLGAGGQALLKADGLVSISDAQNASMTTSATK
ncbi:MAG: phosphate ABC transporter substrate-binding protein [Euryarchaeota archaeon]|nr:phosphate ABC transporter substrate-binding protein [Euryarchaeota archaeon]